MQSAVVEIQGDKLNVKGVLKDSDDDEEEEDCLERERETVCIHSVIFCSVGNHQLN